MKTAAKVFAIIDIVYGAILTLCGLVDTEESGLICLLLGLYCLGISIGSLIAINGKSKTAINILAVFNLPVSPLGAVFMFNMKMEAPKLDQPQIYEEPEETKYSNK